MILFIFDIKYNLVAIVYFHNSLCFAACTAVVLTENEIYFLSHAERSSTQTFLLKKNKNDNDDNKRKQEIMENIRERKKAEGSKQSREDNDVPE